MNEPLHGSFGSDFVERNDPFDHLGIIFLVDSSLLFLDVGGHHHGNLLFDHLHDPCLLKVHSEELRPWIASLALHDVGALVDVVSDTGPVKDIHRMNLALVLVEQMSAKFVVTFFAIIVHQVTVMVDMLIYLLE